MRFMRFMRFTFAASIASSLFVSAFAVGDALTLLQDDFSFEPEGVDAVDPSNATSPWYARVEIGVNLMDDLDPGSDLGQFHLHPGVDGAVSIGYHLTDRIAIEAQAGGSWNRFKEWTQGTKPALDASGNLIQVPLVANVVFRVPLTSQSLEPIFGEDAELLLYGGGGGEYANGTLSAENEDVFTIDGWTFRYHVGAALNAQLADNVKFGLYARISRTGSLDATQPAAGDISFSALMNYAVGMNLSFSF